MKLPLFELCFFKLEMYLLVVLFLTVVDEFKIDQVVCNTTTPMERYIDQLWDHHQEIRPDRQQTPEGPNSIVQPSQQTDRMKGGSLITDHQ